MPIRKKQERTGLTGRGQLIMTITGPREEVEAEVERYLKDYHPAGYGTETKDQGFIEGGDYQVKITRSESCH